MVAQRRGSVQPPRPGGGADEAILVLSAGARGSLPRRGQQVEKVSEKVEKVSATVLGGQADCGRAPWLAVPDEGVEDDHLHMAAVSASFLALPAATKCGWKAAAPGRCLS